MNKKAILFSGQGMQQPGMGKDLYGTYPETKEFYDSIQIRFPIKEYSFDRSMEEISQTRYTQSVIVAFQMAVIKILQPHMSFDYTAGLSIGEYSSLYYSGVLSERETLKIADYRAEYMEDAAKEIDSAMFAVMKTDRKIIEKVCREVSEYGFEKVEISNVNSPAQIVISGEKTACETAVEKLKEQGCRNVVPLNVSGPFHTSYMESAAKKLDTLFEDISFQKQKVPVVFNTVGREKNEDESIQKLMTEQVQKPVLFCDSIQYMITHGVDYFVEVGFQNVLKGLIRKIDPSVTVVSANSVETIEELLKG